jgi:hypothetical protein
VSTVVIGGLFFGLAEPLAAAQKAARSNATPLLGYKLKASNGYSIEVSGQGKKVWATVEKRGGFAFYKVRGESSAAGIWATFGSLGRVRMTFTPVSIKRFDPPTNCHGQQRRIVQGRFAGRFHFRGEEGYTGVTASSAQGNLYIWPQWKCRQSATDSSAAGRLARLKRYVSLEAVARRGDLTFGAMHVPHASGRSEPRVSLTAGLVEQRGRMRIDRFVQVTARQAAFTFDSILSMATVRPSRPFFGAATFVRDVDGLTSWSGPLGVSFPGVSGVRLTGEHFQARLYRH